MFYKFYFTDPALAATLYNKCVFCVNSTALIFVQDTDDITYVSYSCDF